MDKIICVGKNYLEHAKELVVAVPEKPVLFIKPPSILFAFEKQCSLKDIALVTDKGPVHHECEIVLFIGKKSKIDAVSLGLDMTLRDLQSQQKQKGHPWTTSKVFSGSAIVGPPVPLGEFPHWEKEPFEFFLNKSLKQKGRVEQMSLPPKDIVNYIQEYFPVCEGDLIFTGTPAGVGPVQSGDLAQLRWGKIQFEVKWK